MARFLLVLWLMVPLAVVAWHVGPGRARLSEDHADALLRNADRLAAQQRWRDAALAYADARDTISKDAVIRRQELRYAEAVAWMKGGDRAAGRRQMNELLADLEGEQVEPIAARSDAEAAWGMTLQVRNAIASSAYYAAWRLRLERAAPEEWRSQLKTSQHHFRQLVEATDRRARDSAAQRNSVVRRQSRIFRRSLEAAVMLGQIDLTQLAAWPIPEDFPDREEALERQRAIEQEQPLRRKLRLED